MTRRTRARRRLVEPAPGAFGGLPNVPPDHPGYGVNWTAIAHAHRAADLKDKSRPIRTYLHLIRKGRD